MTENQAMSDERLAELRETHGPWHYTEFGVLCSCGEAMDANEECPTLQLVSEIERLRAAPSAYVESRTPNQSLTPAL